MNCVYTYLIGCVIALIGISIISFSGTTMHLNPIGDILSVGAAMVWSFYAVLSKKMGAFGYSVIQTTRRTFFYGILFMIPALYSLTSNGTCNDSPHQHTYSTFSI